MNGSAAEAFVRKYWYLLEVCDYDLYAKGAKNLERIVSAEQMPWFSSEHTCLCLRTLDKLATGSPLGPDEESF